MRAPVAERSQTAEQAQGRSRAANHEQALRSKLVQLVQLTQPHSSVGGSTRVLPPPARSTLEGSGGSLDASRLEGKRILVVEDEFLLADEIVDWLALRGAEPVGPAATLPQGLDLMEQAPAIDCAVLDINLAGTMVFPLALELRRRGVPLLFASAYAQDIPFPDELKDTLRLKKPFSEAQLIRAVELALDASD